MHAAPVDVESLTDTCSGFIPRWKKSKRRKNHSSRLRAKRAINNQRCGAGAVARERLNEKSQTCTISRCSGGVNGGEGLGGIRMQKKSVFKMAIYCLKTCVNTIGDKYRNAIQAVAMYELESSRDRETWIAGKRCIVTQSYRKPTTAGC